MNRLIPELDYNRYEPDATTLVLSIQQSPSDVDSANLKQKLAELLYPFICKLAEIRLSDYSRPIIEDAIHTVIAEHLLAEGPDSYITRTGRHYTPYVYKYDHAYSSGRIKEHSFCGYLHAVLTYQFLVWYRRLPPQENTLDNPGKYSRPTQDKSEDPSVDFDSALFLIFCDYVNRFDMEHTSTRKIHERGLLSFHMDYGIRSARQELFPSPQTDRFPHSFYELASDKYAESMLCLLSLQSNFYRRLTGSEEDFLSVLRQRVLEKKIADESFLNKKEDIVNKAYGWIKTIRIRINKEKEQLTELFRKKQEETFYAIR